MFETTTLKDCTTCAEYTEMPIRDIKWSVGVTTVPQRRKDLLPKTLESLSKAGFVKPRLFVDGCSETDQWRREFDCEVTCHYPRMRTFGNWVLALWELYVRDPSHHYYAIFQDDCVAYQNLKQYLEKCNYPEKGYWNLYNVPENEKLCPKEEGEYRQGWYKSNQLGKGAVGLVFSREAVCTLLGHSHMVTRPQDVKRGHRSIDGGIVTALKKAGYTEYVHYPTLLQHTGKVSSMQNGQHPLPESFLGEDYNALNLKGSKHESVS